MRITRAALALTVLFAACSDNNENEPPEKLAPDGVLGPRVALDARPFGVAVSANGTVLVARLDANAVSRTALGDTAFSGTIPVGSVPTDVAIAPNGLSAYVTNQFGGTLGIISLATNTQDDNVPVMGAPFRVRLSSDGATAFVSGNAASITKVMTGAGQASDTITVGSDPNGVAVSANRLYVTNMSSADLSEVDLASGAVVRTIALGGKPQEALLSLDGGTLYVANEDLGLQVVNLATGNVSAAPGVPGLFGMALSADGTVLLATSPSNGTVLLIDRESLDVVTTLTVGGTPRRVALDPDGFEAVVANEAGWIDFIR